MSHAQTATSSHRIARRVWSAWSLLPISNLPHHAKADASSAHSRRCATSGVGGESSPAFLVLLLAAPPVLADGTNLARLGTASAVSVWHNSPEMAPQTGIDGSLETRWGAEERHGWFQIEWQKPQSFRGVVMRNYDAPWNKNIPFTCQVWDASLNARQGGLPRMCRRSLPLPPPWYSVPRGDHHQAARDQCHHVLGTGGL